MYRGSSPSRNTHQADCSARAIHPLFICLIGIGTLQPTIVVFAAERCPAANATKVVSVQGNVTWSAVSNATLNAAKFNDLLCVGDTVRVGAKSRAVLRLSNETTIPLDQNTIFQLKEAISEKEPTLIDLLQGAIHIITRTPKPFKVNTPYLNAVVEGTEFYVGVDNAEARVAVIEGKVNVSNEQGAVLLTDNEAATARKGQAPQKTLTIKPRDAVQWALYYPPLFDPRSRSGGQNLSASHDLYSRGKITEAIESLDAIPDAERNGDYYSYRAGLLLLVGRADEAEPDIETALRENGNNTDALSLKAIIAIVKNDKAKALELANQAVNIDDKSAQARIALSYALQANFKIEDALKQAKQATEREPNNALAWARVAELELSIPNYDKSKEAAEKAVALNPNLARTQSVLGFANLTRIDIKEAKNNFSRAIELDQADPLPRLGLGLATIREGNLEQGREQIEIAASLDPENSLIRSYLGKAYYEEKRGDKAATQFALAKERDSKNPTSYLYDAIRLQAENQPVEAREGLDSAIALSDRQLVYRSTFLVEQDIAARNTSLAKTYVDLGFESTARDRASSSIALDPSNYSAHRFLADTYVGRPRYEIARVSELLQSQLLRPTSSEPVQPRLSVADLGLFRTDSSFPSSYDYWSLFDRDGHRIGLTGMIGNHAYKGEEIVVAGIIKNFSYSAGQSYSRTDGFRRNNSLHQSLQNVIAQYYFQPWLSAQAEFRHRRIRRGDLSFNFDPDSFDPTLRTSIDQDVARIGLRYAPTPNSTLLISGAYTDFDGSLGTGEPGNDFFGTDDSNGNQFEAQYINLGSRHNLVLGAGSYRLRSKETGRFSFQDPSGEFCPIDSVCEFQLSNSSIDSQSNAYAYVNSRFSEQWTTTLGLGWSKFKDSTIAVSGFNPKLGLKWESDKVRAAIVWFRDIKRALPINQTIEPTQIAGFNQFFDDFNGTRTTTLGARVDAEPLPKLALGAESFSRKKRVPISVSETEVVIDREKENYTAIYLNWIIGPNWALGAQLTQDRYRRYSERENPGEIRPTSVRTTTFPIGLKYFHSNGIFAGINAIGIRQVVHRYDELASGQGRSRFNLVDFVFGYKLKKPRLTVGLDVRNVFNKKFSFLDDNVFRESEIMLPRFVPRRSYLLRGSATF